MLETAANSSINVTGTLGSAININPWADGLERWIAARTGLSPSVSDVVTALILLAAFLILSRISRHFVTDVAPHLVSKTGSTLDDELLKALKGPIQALIIVIGVYLACKSLNNLPSLIIFVLDKLASVMLILVGAYFVSNVVNALIQWYVNDLAPKTGSDMDDHLMPFLRKFLVVSIYVIALVMVIGLFTEITPLLAGLGVFGIAIAFAAKEALSNLFGAFAILTDRPYKEGDRLFVKGVGTGDVMEMGMRSTRVKTLDNHIVIIPNERLAAGRIVNLSQPDKKIRLELKFGVGYTADTDKACSMLEQIAMETPSVSQLPKPAAYVSELGDFAVAISLLVWIDSYKSDLDVADSIYRKALVAFKKEGIEIPYPTMSVKPK